ncbi:MAG: hypothetical protein NVS3B7_01760 [Candidatus Elarobacter sp.]
MLSLLPIVLALASIDPSPSAAPSGRPTPLTEIGRVRALPICTPIVVHANSAITTTLDNDRQLAVITTNLRNTDFERLNEMQRRNALEALMKQASAIRIQSGNADGEIKKLRAYAVASSDPTRKTELKAFADAIGGAIYRQKKAAAEMMRDLTIVQGRQEAAEARNIQNRDNPPPDTGAAGAIVSRQRLALPGAPSHYNETMRGIAKALDDDTQAILLDEGTAADHSVSATAGC